MGHAAPQQSEVPARRCLLRRVEVFPMIVFAANPDIENKCQRKVNPGQSGIHTRNI